jgi:hypothetical protein
MGYYTTIKVVDNNGRPAKAEITCGGTFRGFTDSKTGELSFELSSNSSYSVSAKRMGNKTSGTVIGGQTITLRV